MSELSAVLEVIDRVIEHGQCKPEWDSIIENCRIPRWYEQAKFGIFIHWGVYSVPAFGNEWYPRNMYVRGSAEYEHHLKTYGPHDRFGYKDFIPQFKAERFDPRAWAELFHQSGAKYVVPVAEHHDGFAMYDCSFTDWSALKMGPRRDVIAELSAAVQEVGLVFGASTHRAENYWFYGHGRQIQSDVVDPRYRGLYNVATYIEDFHGNPSDHPAPPQDHLDDWLARTCELADKFQPRIIYFDWWIEHRAFEPYLRKFAAYYYNRAIEWGREVVINYKLKAFPPGAAVFDVERGQLADIRTPFWQTDTSVSRNSWGHVSNQKYKPVGEIIHDLVDIVSKNGGLLLNIGPKSDGTIPEPEQRILKEIGKWLSINGEAIYDTRPWHRFGEGPTLIPGGGFSDKSRVPFTANDVRFTCRDGALYAILLGWQDNGIAMIDSITTVPQNVRMLGIDQPLKFSCDSRGLHVNLPPSRPCDHAFVLKIEG
ncbi:MAG TPA: alpha-L-fucosidase [Tepidisphaeraceae bacterium]|nr:alpha-L-fucosidase [Tepidisphaeraceae bacterium]